jgi:hypothetical protein
LLSGTTQELLEEQKNWYKGKFEEDEQPNEKLRLDRMAEPIDAPLVARGTQELHSWLDKNYPNSLSTSATARFRYRLSDLFHSHTAEELLEML